MGGKTQTATTQQTTTPINQAALQSIYNTVAGAASTPYTPYTGELTAPVNQQQTAGINAINQASGYANPFIQSAAGLAQGAANPLTASQIQQFESPYIQNVVDATQAQFNDQNAQAQNALKGNAAMQGALGGDRQAVAQTTLAKNQQIAQAPTIANLYNTGYNNAVQTATQQYQTNPLAAASAIGNLGVAGQNAALQGANAQVAAGTLQQQTQQAQDQAAYQQYLQAQGYPYAQAAFLQQYGLPTALAQGTTSSGTQTGQGPNLLTQLLGLGTAGLTAYSDKRVKENVEPVGKTFDGQPIYRFNYVGNPMTQIGLIAQDVEHSHPDAVGESNGIKTVDYSKATDAAADRGKFASGGSTGLPFGGVSFIPSGGASNAKLDVPSLQYMKQPDQTKDQNNPFSAAGKFLGVLDKTPLSGPAYGGGNFLTDEYGGSSSNPLPGLTKDDYEDDRSRGGFIDAIHRIHQSIRRATGGAVRRYDDGGGVSFADRFSPAVDNPFGDLTRGQALGLITATHDGIQAPRSIGGDDRLSTDVVNPDSPLRMDPQADEAWRAGVDHPNDAVMAAVGAPPALPRQITNLDNVSEEPSTALGYSASSPMSMPAPSSSAALSPFSNPAPSSSASEESRFGSFNPFGLSDKAREAIIAGALGMASSRSPFPLSAIAEGGLTGLRAYQQGTQSELEAADKARQRAQEQQRIDMQAQQLAANLENQRRTAASAPLISDGKGGMTTNPAYIALEKQKAEIAARDKFIPAGTISSGGELHPAVLNQATGQIIDSVTGKPPQIGDKVQSKDMAGKNDPAIAQHIGDGIISGRQPPSTTGLYGQGPSVRSYLEDKGFDLAKAQMEWDRAKKQIATLNGPQMTRFVGLAKSVDSTIDEVRELAKELQNSGVPILNRAKLATYMQVEGNSANGQLAARYIGAVNTLKEEFANLANGGYAPTEPAWKLANEQINGDYGVKQLGASLDEVQRLIRYRVNAMPGLAENGPGASNRYTGQSGTPPAASPPPTRPAAPGRPANVPDGSAYSPSLNRWRSPDGTMFDAQGKRVP